MSLHPQPIQPIPDATAEVARAAFPKGNPYLTLRDELGTIFTDELFADLFPTRGQKALSPWRLALVTVMQFRENLSDRQAADAVRGRIDWKYLLGLELTDPGFDFSVLCEFRGRLIGTNAELRLLDTLLAHCRDLGLVKSRGRQRTDSTHVLACVRELNRLELIGETLRAALNEIATVAPEWLQGIAPKAWYDRYSHRVEDRRLPRTAAERDTYAQTMGEDGYMLLAQLDAPAAPPELQHLPQVNALRRVWARHYVQDEPPSPGSTGLRLKTKHELAQVEEKIESPYDTEARYRSKSGMHWTGYMVHISETCDDDNVHLITQVHTSTADVHEAMCTDTIHQALADKNLLPKEHLVDAGYVSAELLVHRQTEYGIDLVGPARENPTWQNRSEGAYTRDQFTVDWEQQIAHCPQGVASVAWRDYVDAQNKPYHLVYFPNDRCRDCPTRCTKAKTQPRRLYLHPKAQHDALEAARKQFDSEAGRKLYAHRAGVEGSLSQGVRAFGVRRTRYRGLEKTHLQQVASAVAINFDRLVAWLTGTEQALTRTSRFATLAPVAA